MPRSFKLKGDFPTVKKQLEEILPRIMSRMSTKTYGIIPSSIVSFHKDVVLPNEPIFKCGMFKGKVKKLLFMLDQPEGKLTPEYILKISMDSEERRIKVNTKKLSHIMEVDLDIPEGTILEVIQITEDIVLTNVYITALIVFDQDLGEIKEFITEELIKDLEDEGI